MFPAHLQPLAADDPARVGGFELLGRLGDADPDGMAVSYLARAADGGTAALTVARERCPYDRFTSAVRAVHAIGGRYAAEVLAAQLSGDDRPWVATEYLPGLLLTDAVAGYGPFSGRATLALAVPLARALSDVRRAGTARLRLTPATVTLTASGPRITAVDIATGPADDVHALGAVLVFAATGRPPRPADLPGLTAVPPEVRPLAARLLAAEPHRRPDPAELAGAIEAPVELSRELPPPLVAEIARRTHDHDEPRPAADQPPDPSGRGPSRRATVMAAAGSVAGAAIAGIVSALVHGRPPTAAGIGVNPSSPVPLTPTATRPPGVAPRPLWTYDSVPLADAPPLPVDQRTVVLAGADGSLVGVDRASGQRRWHTGGFNPAAAAQITGDGLVAGLSQGAGPPTLAALAPANGRRRWELPVPRGLALIGGGIFASDTEACYLAATASGPARHGTAPQGPGQTYLLRYDLDTREERWRTPLDHADRTATPRATVDRARLVVVDGGYLASYDTRDGRQRSRTRLRGERDGRPAADGTRAYAATGGAVVAVDLGSGRIAWRTADTSRGTAYGDPAVLGGVVYATERTAGLVALDASSGRRLWSCASPVPLPTDDAPVVYRDRVYAATGDSRVWVSVFELSGRRIAWTYRSPRAGSGRTRIAFLGEQLYVRNGDTLQALPMD
ncbi:PQQ-binding-like beta-propeller repeat protein [Streptomyces sp. NPDC020096]